MDDTKKFLRALDSCRGVALFATGAHADEVRVLAAGAAKHALEEIAPAFVAATAPR
jgi:ABC-type molybdate transport system substrate-binding protein